jgi:hypothetical protein
MVCEHCGGTIPSALHGSYSQTTVKNGTSSVKVEDLEIPSFNIDIPKINIPTALAHDDDNSFDEEDGPVTERLNEPRQISVYDMLNTRYLNKIAFSIYT